MDRETKDPRRFSAVWRASFSSSSARSAPIVGKSKGFASQREGSSRRAAKCSRTFKAAAAEFFKYITGSNPQARQTIDNRHRSCTKSSAPARSTTKITNPLGSAARQKRIVNSPALTADATMFPNETLRFRSTRLGLRQKAQKALCRDFLLEKNFTLKPHFPPFYGK